MGEEEKVRKLAELKAFLEKRTVELEQELLKVRSLKDLVDNVLADRSFRRVEVPKLRSRSKQVISSNEVETITPIEKPVQVIPIMTASKIELADMHITKNEIRLISKPDMRFDANSPPMRAFLIGRVLESMQSKDKEAIRTGQKKDNELLTYQIGQDGDNLKQIIITNYGDEGRLQELRSAISWTLRRMHERSTSKG